MCVFVDISAGALRGQSGGQIPRRWSYRFVASSPPWMLRIKLFMTKQGLRSETRF